MVRLVISDHEGSTTVVPLLRDEVTIGRKEGNTIRLTERNISRRHLQLLRNGGVYKLRDLDSYNGVLVNGRKVEGETTLNSGDQIQLGDYTILVEEDVNARSGQPQQQTHSQAPAREAALPHSQQAGGSGASRRPAVPARLVMLTQPASGAEFVLPTDRSARLGRSDEVDCPINHRSVSREHAAIKPDGEQFVIEDLASANGVTVNGRQIKSVDLHSGDIIELGQVVFRYVAAGEHYFFDPGEASRYRNVSSSSRGNTNARLAILLGVVTLVALVFVLLPAPEVQQPPDIEASPIVAANADGMRGRGDDLDPNYAPPVMPMPADDGYDKAYLACRSALVDSRFAEAAAHASLALKLQPGSSEALDCKQRADVQSLEEQFYVRGKDALQRGDVELAFGEFSKLSENSGFRARPEVSQALSEVANKRLVDARAALPGNRAEAARLATSVLLMRGANEKQLGDAQQLLAETRSGKETKEPKVSSRESGREAVRESNKEPSPPPSPRPQTTTTAARPKPAPSPTADARPSSSLLAPTQGTDPRASSAVAGARPLDIANACLARGDNECVVHALEGSASTPQELGLLIETYRTIGDVRQAKKYMATYVQRYPSEKPSETYRRLLELQKQ